MAHNVGLATSIGGTLFGSEALEPALKEITDRRQRAQVSKVAWNRFSWLNLAGHAVMAATWFAGRSMLSGRSVSSTARTLTIAKDALVVASLATGIASIVLGRILGERTTKANSESNLPFADDAQQNQRLHKAVGTLGMANLAANLGIAGVTTALSMEASHSVPFAFLSRRMP